jgi:hypothetical protein
MCPATLLRGDENVSVRAAVGDCGKKSPTRELLLAPVPRN